MEPVLAVTPNTDEAFLREVDEELRRDQVIDLWQRWGRWLIGAVVLGLAALAGVLFWQHHQQSQAGQQGEQLQTAFDALAAENNAAAAPTLAKLATSSSPGYRAIALFTQADVATKANDTKGAVAKLSAISSDASLAQPFRDAATIQQTALEYDSLKPEVVVDRLKGLAKPGSAWFGSAGEMVAVAYIRMNKKADAGRLYSQIAQDQSVPDSIRQRAVQMAGVLGVDAVAQNEDKKAQ
jgi:hypothetical protein